MGRLHILRRYNDYIRYTSSADLYNADLIIKLKLNANNYLPGIENCNIHGQLNTLEYYVNFVWYLNLLYFTLKFGYGHFLPRPLEAIIR
jgi:hypothetical protein